MSEPIIVAGRRVKIDGTEGYFYIANADFDDARYVQKDGKWHSTTGFDRGYWPTEAAAREFASSLAARSRPAEVADGWRTIDSAPKDGTWVALWHKDYVLTKAGYWGGTYFGNHHAWITWAHRSDSEEVLPVPTHWQPLPTPPVPQEPDHAS